MRQGLQILPADQPRESSEAFVKPYPQPALNGEPGLTSEEMARGAKMQHQHFKRQLREADYLEVLRESGLHFVHQWTKTGKRGRPKEIWVFGVETAKVLLAQMRTKAGVEYVCWLIACERAAHKMAGEITRLRNRVEELETKRQYRYRIYKGVRTHVQLELFAPPIRKDERVVVEKTKAEMDENEKYLYLATKLTAQAEGCTKKANALLKGVEPKVTHMQTKPHHNLEDNQ